MDNEPTGAADASPHERLRDTLRARYDVRGEYVGASLLARILGLGRTTIHDQIKANRFVIPHRVVNRKPLFSLDDLVAWMLGAPRPSGPSAATPVDPIRAHCDSGPPVFRHRSAEDAFLRVCKTRGMKLPDGH